MILEGIELDVCPAFGWMGGPNFETLIKRLRNGHERRRPVWGSAKHSYSLPFQNIRSDEYLRGLKSLFLSAMGQTHSFLVKDQTDFQAEAEVFATGNGTATSFELTKDYRVDSYGYTRRIMFPIDPVFYVNGVETAATFNSVTQRVVFDAAPGNLSVISWSGEFRVLVRFSSDSFPMSIENKTGSGFALSGSVDLIEVWE